MDRGLSLTPALGRHPLIPTSWAEDHLAGLDIALPPPSLGSPRLPAFASPRRSRQVGAPRIPFPSRPGDGG